MKRFFPGVTFFFYLLNNLNVSGTPLLAGSIEQNPSPAFNESLSYQEECADNAFELGLYAIAKGFYKQALETLHEENLKGQLSAQAEKFLHQRYTVCLLHQFEAQQALQFIQTHEAFFLDDTGKVIRAITLLTAQQRSQEALSTLQGLNPETLDPFLKTWYFLSLARSAYLEEKFKKAEHFLLAAEQAAQEVPIETQMQRAYLEILLLKQSPPENPATESALKKVRRQINKFSNGQGIPPKLALEYTKLLLHRGHPEEAFNFLEKTIEQLPFRYKNHWGELMLFKAMLLQEYGKDNQAVLESLFHSHKEYPQAAQLALALFFSKQEIQHYEKHFFTLEIIREQTEDADFKAMLGTIQAYIAWHLKNTHKAVELAQMALADNPSNPYAKELLFILAYEALTREVPAYRLAADFFAQIAEKSNESAQRAKWTLWLADCFALNHDYDHAAELYTGLFQQWAPSAPFSKDFILLQAVNAYLENNNLSKACALLARTLPETQSNLALWSAHWNYVQALRKNNQKTLALKHVESLMQAEGNNLPVDFHLKMFWLKAFLSLENGQAQAALNTTKTLFSLLKSENAATLKPLEIENIASNGLLVKGQALMQLGEESNATETFKQLREAYPNTIPALFSYIEEARWDAKGGNFKKAQKRLTQLAEEQPDSEYAPACLYEAALNGDKMGTQENLQESLQLLESILKNYPNHPICFYARLKQGEYLLKMDRFKDAQILYSNLLQTQPDHPRIVLVKKYFADALLAQGMVSGNTQQLKEAALAYETILHLPESPFALTVESAHKAALAYQKLDLEERAKQLLWTTINQFLENQKQQQTPPLAGTLYWVSKNCLELAAIFEKDHDFLEASKVYTLMENWNLPGYKSIKEKQNL